MMNFLIVGIGGFIGASARYLVSKWINRFIHSSFIPVGTLSVNWLGSFCFGLLSPIGNSSAKLFFMTGIIAAFTTFSTFSIESVKLIQKHKYLYVSLYISISVIGSIGLFAMGYRMVSSL